MTPSDAFSVTCEVNTNDWLSVVFAGVCKAGGFLFQGCLLNSEPSRRNTLSSDCNLRRLVCSENRIGSHLQVASFTAVFQASSFMTLKTCLKKICVQFQFCLPACLPRRVVKSCGRGLEGYQGHCCSYRLSIHSGEKRKKNRHQAEGLDVKHNCSLLLHYWPIVEKSLVNPAEK